MDWLGVIRAPHPSERQERAPLQLVSQGHGAASSTGDEGQREGPKLQPPRSHVQKCLETSGLRPKERQYRLHELWVREHREPARALAIELVDGIRRWICKESPLPDWWLVLESHDVGTGKTVLAQAAVVEVCLMGKRAHFVKAAELVDSMKPGGDEQAMENYRRTPLLVIDDIGTEYIARDSEFAAAQLYTILDERDREGKPVVATTNLTVDELAERYGPIYGNRIVSRLYGGCRNYHGPDPSWLVMDGPDLRQQRGDGERR